MTDPDREFARVRRMVLMFGAVAWILLIAGPATLTHCAMTVPGAVTWRGSLQMLVAMNPPASLATGWALMLVAMMSPVLILPIRHVWLQSFRHRRVRSIGLFVAGYSTIWFVAGVFVFAGALTAAVLARQWYLPLAGAFLAALWQFSPIKQQCLNRGHAHTPLAVFGFAADRDALCFGLSHGIWCVGSCWALMMFPMLLPQWHLPATAAASFLIFSERLEHPAWPRWGWRVSSKLMRIIFAQTRIRLNSLRLASEWPSDASGD
jgi:predicted metal-binding membrane protein